MYVRAHPPRLDHVFYMLTDKLKNSYGVHSANVLHLGAAELEKNERLPSNMDRVCACCPRLFRRALEMATLKVFMLAVRATAF
jgi:hypothetical protein